LKLLEGKKGKQMTKKTTKQILKNYEQATQDLAEFFVKKYFGKDAECSWVSDRIGDVFYVNDYRFDVGRMREALEYKATSDQLFEYWNYELEMWHRGEKVRHNFVNYLEGIAECLNH
jgi:hypothetical protein